MICGVVTNSKIRITQVEQKCSRENDDLNLWVGNQSEIVESNSKDHFMIRKELEKQN